MAIIISCIALVNPATAAKVALVIGNSAYEHAVKLKNPANDAKAIADRLSTIGFEVISANNLSRSGFETQLTTFADKSKTAKISIVYYAGHGLQVDGHTYLVPTDAKVSGERDLRLLIRADHVLQDAARATKLAVVILDACRDNPFLKSLAEAMGPTRSAAVGQGLSRIAEVPRNTLVAYATRAGNVALDGKNQHSPYASALLQHIHTPKQDIRIVFGSIRDTVLELTKQRQEPFTYGSLGGQLLYLNASETAPATTTPSATAAPISEKVLTQALKPVLVRQVELVPHRSNAAQPIKNQFAAWQSARQSNNWSKIEQLRIEYPDTLYGYMAEMLLREAAKRGQTVDQAIKNLSSFRADLNKLPSNVVKEIQKKLSDTSYYGGQHTGRVNAQTREALYAFVRDVYGSGYVSFESILVLAELADTQNISEQLSGRWKGTYHYPRPNAGVKTVPFQMDLILSQGWVTGYVAEPATFGDGTSKNLYATFSGAITGNKVVWTKTYDGTGGVTHSIRYSGTLDRKKRRIEGRWFISAAWNGKFHIELNEL